MANIREKMAKSTAKLRSTEQISKTEIKPTNGPMTAPGMLGALAAAKAKISELESEKAADILLPVDAMEPNPWQPRTKFDEEALEALAASIKETGQMQPIVVRATPNVDGRYQIVVGERRWRAHKLLGLKEIKALVAPLDDAEMSTWALSENINREDLTDYEISKAIVKAQEDFPTKKAIIEAVGISRTQLYRYLDYQKLPAFVLADLDEKPEVLGGNATSAIVKVLSKHKDEAVQALQAIWPLLMTGEIEQSKVADMVQAEIARPIKRPVVTERVMHLSINGRRAGYVKKDGKALTVRVKSNSLSPSNEEKLIELLKTFYVPEGKLDE